MQLSLAWWRLNWLPWLSMTRKRKVRIGLGLLILAFSILLLAWGFWPAHREMRVRPVSVNTATALPDARPLALWFPPRIRVGEAGVVRLTLDVDAAIDFFSQEGEIDPSTFYDGHDVIAEARFDLPGLPVQPSELISAPVTKGQTAVFYWTLRPGEAGKYRGTIWLYLRATDKLTGGESRETISAQIVEIEALKLLGLPVSRVRLLGLAGFLIGLFLCLPLFEARIGGFLQKRRSISN